MILALGIQHAMRIRRLLSVSGPTLQFFSTLSHKRHDFRKTVVERKMRVLFFSTTFIIMISHSKNN